MVLIRRKLPPITHHFLQLNNFSLKIFLLFFQYFEKCHKALSNLHNIWELLFDFMTCTTHQITLHLKVRPTWWMSFNLLSSFQNRKIPICSSGLFPFLKLWNENKCLPWVSYRASIRNCSQPQVVVVVVQTERNLFPFGHHFQKSRSNVDFGCQRQATAFVMNKEMALGIRQYRLMSGWVEKLQINSEASSQCWGHLEPDQYFNK